MSATDSFLIPAPLEAEIDELITHYPEKRSASLMLLHALQEHFGYLSKEAMEWTAGKLGLEPINIFELVTFYPMFRQMPAGQYHFKVCRTLSCALGGAYELREKLCRRFELDAHAHGLQVSSDKKFSIEFVECLASCGTAPVLMMNDEFHEGVNDQKLEQILGKCS